MNQKYLSTYIDLCQQQNTKPTPQGLLDFYNKEITKAYEAKRKQHGWPESIKSFKAFERQVRFGLRTIPAYSWRNLSESKLCKGSLSESNLPKDILRKEVC